MNFLFEDVELMKRLVPKNAETRQGFTHTIDDLRRERPTMRNKKGFLVLYYHMMNDPNCIPHEWIIHPEIEGTILEHFIEGRLNIGGHYKVWLVKQITKFSSKRGRKYEWVWYQWEPTIPFIQ